MPGTPLQSLIDAFDGALVRLELACAFAKGDDLDAAWKAMNSVLDRIELERDKSDAALRLKARALALLRDDLTDINDRAARELPRKERMLSSLLRTVS